MNKGCSRFSSWLWDDNYVSLDTKEELQRILQKKKFLQCAICLVNNVWSFSETYVLYVLWGNVLYIINWSCTTNRLVQMFLGWQECEFGNLFCETLLNYFHNYHHHKQNNVQFLSVTVCIGFFNSCKDFWEVWSTGFCWFCLGTELTSWFLEIFPKKIFFWQFGHSLHFSVFLNEVDGCPHKIKH